MTADLVFVATADLSAQVRGRAVPVADESGVLRTGTGWVPANLALDAFGAIAPGNVFGSVGDLRLLPDPASRAEIPADGDYPGVRIYLADQVQLDGSSWGGCPRTFLRSALDDLQRATGLQVVASFEHEFFLDGLSSSGPFTFSRLRGAEPFGSDLVRLLDDAGLQPENWLPEYGTDQFEITLKPAAGLVAADRAVLLKELVRDLARRRGLRASFAPVRDEAGSGCGVHIHFSLRDGEGRPVLHDPSHPAGLSDRGIAFAAGILAHADALLAWTAPSPASFVRLRPHRWSAGASYLADRDREALLRICPTTTLGDKDLADQFNLEFRGADATANPFLALAVLIRAGLEGLKGAYAAPTVWPEGTDEPTLRAAGVPPLPSGLPDALLALEKDDVVRGWFAPDLLATHLAVKRNELAHVAGLTTAEMLTAVADVY